MAKTKITEKTIEETYFKGGQSLEFKGIYEINKLKVKMNIKKDSYANQSYGRVWVWKDLEWSLIDSIHYSQLAVVLADLYYGSAVDDRVKALFNKDIKLLRAKAINILI